MQKAIQQATIFSTEPRGCVVGLPFGGPAASYDTNKVGRRAAAQCCGLRPIFAGDFDDCV